VIFLRIKTEKKFVSMVAKRLIDWSSACVFSTLAVLSLTVVRGQSTTHATKAPPPPVVLTAEQDHQRIMDLLKIKSLLPGADGRNTSGERVENVAGSAEYHWMAGNFLKYAGPLSWNDLPVDSHELIALCAPRPVFISVRVSVADEAWYGALAVVANAI